MSLTSRLVARLAGLRRASSRDVVAEKGLAVPTPDGVTLLADRYYPRGGERLPLILIRSPYGRTRFALFGRLFAERGYQALVQSVRGTFGSGGTFDPYQHEEADGRATLDWLAQQPWFGGVVGTFGPSYLGLTQWAMAVSAPERIQAMALQITSSCLRASRFSEGAFALDTSLSWVYTLAYQELPWWQLLRWRWRGGQRLRRAYAHLPLNETDQVATGRQVKFYQDWLVHTDADDPYWTRVDFSRRVGQVTAPASLVGGWYDIFLPDQLADYAALRRAGREVHLTVGPWTHTSLGVQAAGLREALAWFDKYLRGDPARVRRLPVRLYLMGARRWLELPDWPPPAVPTPWYLQAGGGLGLEPPLATPPDRYDYDPANPTPSLGGVVLERHAGPRDNRPLEARADVLTYTSGPLERELSVVGPVEVELWVRSNLEHTDFFVRLCDVAPGGRSTNVCDGLVRLHPEQPPVGPDGTRQVRVELWPTAYRFRPGHRLRVLVASGAHPRFNRNTGSGEPLATATTLLVAHQAIYHNPSHPSAILLPHWQEGA